MPGKGDRGGKKEKPKDARGALRRILSYLMVYRWSILGLLLLAVLSNIGNLFGPRFAGAAIGAAEEGYRQGIGHVDMARVRHYALLMLTAYVMSNVLSLLVTFGMTRIGKRAARNMRRDVFDKLMLISLPLVLCMVFTIPVSILFTRYMGRRIRPLYAARSAAYGEMNGYAEEMFTGQKTILAYAHEDEICRRFSAINKKAAESYRNADGLGMSMFPTIGMISNFGLAAIGMGGAVLYMQNIVGLGQISSFVLYSRKFSGPINEISNIINEIFSALAASERVFRLLDQPEEAADIYGAVELKDAKGHVEAQDIRFGYIPGKSILRDFSMEAAPGQTVALVGPTGAGKTTVINLLMRFYDAQEGRILVDGLPQENYTRTSLRRSYAMVLQDTWVFRGTIFENIAYGKENATMDEVVQAAKAARIHNYIMRLPQGYETVITEDGGNISKGQKQLLTIARAMLYGTKMLILDEATSNVDTSTERQVQKAIRSLMNGRTSFVIAHRLSTIRGADQILVIEHGDVVERGTHSELMSKKGAYYRLYASQFE